MKAKRVLLSACPYLQKSNVIKLNIVLYDSLQTCMVAENTLTKQSRTAGKGWSSSLRLDEGLTTPRNEKSRCYVM